MRRPAAAGTDFPYDAFLPRTPRIAQVDVRAERLGRRSRLDLGLCGDVGETIDALLPLVDPKADRAFLDAMRARHDHSRRKLRAYVEHVGTRRPIHPEHVAATLNELASADAVFTVDTGMPTVWAARYLHAAKGRRLIGSFNHGSMANALPQAIGAQVAYPDRQVISLSGDGGLAMLMGELLTLGQHELPVKIVLFNNHTLGMVELEMKVAGLSAPRLRAQEPELRRGGGGGRTQGVRVEDPAQVRPALERVLRVQGPCPRRRRHRSERARDAAEGDDRAGQGVRARDDEDGLRGRARRRDRHRDVELANVPMRVSLRSRWALPQKSCKQTSCPRKRASRGGAAEWIPAFAGMTDAASEGF